MLILQKCQEPSQLVKTPCMPVNKQDIIVIITTIITFIIIFNILKR